MAELQFFEIGNYRSFYKPQTIYFGENSARSITALYGPNASGKSNVVKALSTMISCIVNSANAGWRLPYDPFLLRVGADAEPTVFKIAFKVEGTIFTYSFSYDRTRILSESLLEQAGKSRKSRVIFARDANDGYNSSAVKYGFGKKLQAKTRPETLIITKAREDNNDYANRVFELLSSILIVSDASRSGEGPVYVEMLKRDAGLRKKLVELLQKCDIAIRDIRLETKPLSSDIIDMLPVVLSDEMKEVLVRQGATEFKTMHALRDEELTTVGTRELDFWFHESMGTRNFFEVAVPIISAIDNGQTIFIDEFSSYIHPELASAIIGMFRKDASSGGAAKLVFITHNTSMMSSDLQRDEIILVEKTLGEESRLIPLIEAGARKSEAFEKRYLSGYYGAVPRIKE